MLGPLFLFSKKTPKMLTVDASYIREILNYDPISGVAIWNKRPRTDFKLAAKHKAWNKKWEGTEAGHIDPATGRLRLTLNDKVYFLDKLAWMIEYNEIPNQLYHINGWNCDNSLDNLTTDKHRCRPATKYKGGIIRLYKDDIRYSITSDLHAFSFHLDLLTAKTRFLELVDKLQADWENLL